jgi:uncharacterized protein (TIGR02284 family)
LFTQFSATSQKCKQALEEEVSRLGGTAAEGTMVTGKFFRVWMDVKAALTGKDRKAILNSCEYGEDVAKGTYEDALEDDAKYLNPAQIAMVTEQYELLKEDHDTVKSMRDAVLVD